MAWQCLVSQSPYGGKRQFWVPVSSQSGLFDSFGHLWVRAGVAAPSNPPKSHLASWRSLGACNGQWTLCWWQYWTFDSVLVEWQEKWHLWEVVVTILGTLPIPFIRYKLDLYDETENICYGAMLWLGWHPLYPPHAWADCDGVMSECDVAVRQQAHQEKVENETKCDARWD